MYINAAVLGVKCIFAVAGSGVFDRVDILCRQRGVVVLMVVRRLVSLLFTCFYRL